MNKLLFSMASMVLVLGLAACGGNSDDPSMSSNGHEENDVGTDTNPDQNGSNPDNGAMDENGENNGGQNGNDSGEGDMSNLKRDKETADRVSTVEGVESATVFLSDENAYVAVELAEGTEETDELKTKISDEVKAAKPDVDNVYVSANPDFAKQFRDYGERLDQGDPVEGFIDEFGDLVRRAFPDAQ
ncbi:YhcN/YlaJ family sporulation lipoprotein [Bhargavaea ginsengi]|uniref:YhcN/YlaJ family sporulation lipoprotein n=1 Tax=Bhargavaea ginsengi TaxID=426757 RepID=UPI00204201E1|nr:YhcN/YlaJ family sporulation lipoprotein [Bhargavaea ginsengi]MCM3088984.1 YhcN/YlaJ family sporulation lipoprotein [Bhargavaea ginsengi]